MTWKKPVIIVFDIVLAAYLVLAFTAFNKPDESAKVCTKVIVNVADESSNGFIDPTEIQRRLKQAKVYPLNKSITEINTRKVEETLKSSPFVKTAECYKTQDGNVYITLTQLMPVVRVKADNGNDYYIDDKDCIMPNSHYTSDLMIATGNISQNFAVAYLSTIAKTLMANHFWSNQIEQINVLPNRGIEFIPRVGNHIVYIGQLPGGNIKEECTANTVQFVTKQMNRLEKFYKYGLSQAGWDKYSYINLEFENQIICKRRKAAATVATAPAETKPTEPKPAETKPLEVKPAEKKPAEKKPAEKKQ